VSVSAGYCPSVCHVDVSSVSAGLRVVSFTACLSVCGHLSLECVWTQGSPGHRWEGGTEKGGGSPRERGGAGAETVGGGGRGRRAARRGVCGGPEAVAVRVGSACAGEHRPPPAPGAAWPGPARPPQVSLPPHPGPSPGRRPLHILVTVRPWNDLGPPNKTSTVSPGLPSGAPRSPALGNSALLTAYLPTPPGPAAASALEFPRGPPNAPCPLFPKSGATRRCPLLGNEPKLRRFLAPE
jgi:hypothetical protein